MTESRRTSRPASSSQGSEGASSPKPRRRAPRPLDSAGRPVQGFGAGAPNGSGPGASGADPRGVPREDAGSGAGEGRRSSRREDAGSSATAEERVSIEWERLRDAAARAAAAGPAPSIGGAVPSLSSILQLLEALRAMLPQELERQFTALVREVLLTLRALIDWYLERLEGDESRERRVEDIPID